MAELEARREARRKKILENSEKRLSKITGVEQKSTKFEFHGVKKLYTHEEKANSAYVDQNKGLSKKRIRPPSTELSSQVDSYQNVQTDDDDNLHNTQNIDMIGKNAKLAYMSVIPIILSFVLVIFELLQIDIRSLHLNKIFIPLLLYELVEYFFTDSLGDPSPNFLISLLLLTNIKSRFITLYIDYFQYFFKIMRDIMVYFFIFTLSYEILSFVLL